MTDPVKISPTTMNYFYPCPAAFDFRRKYSLIKTPQHFTDGTDAHALMEGKEVPKASPKAIDYAKMLAKAREDYTLEMKHQELDQTFEIYPGINLHRIVDAVASMGGQPILVDWKTSSNLEYWPEILASKGNGTGYGKLSPKAAGFQGAAYLIPPPEDEIKKLGLKEWPQVIYFIVATSREYHVFPYSYSEEDHQNFISAARMTAAAIRQNIFPKNRGDACHIGEYIQCDFAEACYGVKGWEKKYKEKNNGNHRD